MASVNTHAPSEAIESPFSSSSEKYPGDEKNKKDLNLKDAEVVLVFEDGDELRESDYSPEQYKKLVRKVDKFLLPIMWLCYGIQFTDKISLATQALFGLREDTGLVGQQYQWLTTIFYITYLCGEFPSNFLLQHWNLGLSLSIYMLCWGICVTCIAAAQNWTHLMILRALQGFFECTISPGFFLVIGSWYKRDEQASRSLFFSSAFAGFKIISDLVMYGIGSHAERHGGLAPWRAISLFLGSLTIVCALSCFVLLGSPKEVRWLSKDEKRMANARIIGNKAGHDVTGMKWNWSQVTEAFLDPALYFSTLNTFLNAVPIGGLTTFGSLLYKSFGFTQLQVLLVGIPRLVLSLIVCLLVGLYTRKVPNRRLFVMAAATLPSFVGLLALALLPLDRSIRWTKWGLYLMSGPSAVSLFLAWTLTPSNFAGRTKKTIVSSATFLGYCVGNMVGAQIFRTKDAPRYVPGTIGASVCQGLAVVLNLAWREWYVWQNRTRDKRAAEEGITKEEQERLGREMGEKDLTDLQNPHFRYTL